MFLKNPPTTPPKAKRPEAERETHEYKRDMCALWVMRAMAHKACNGDPKSPYKFLFDACNDMIGRAEFTHSDFFSFAPDFGIDPTYVAIMDNDCIIVDNNFHRTHKV